VFSAQQARVTSVTVSCASATLAVWTSGWLHGAAAPDDVIDAMSVWADSHEVVAHDAGTATALDLPGFDETPVGLALLLAALRRAGASAARLALPVPVDVRGLGGKGPFGEAALNAGQAVTFAEQGIGLVPIMAADSVMRWTAFDAPTPAVVESFPLGEAEQALSSSMREAATTLIELNVARQRPNLRAELAALTEHNKLLTWPDGMPSRVLRVLQRSAEVAAIVELATQDAPGRAVSASAARLRSEALRPLSETVRHARVAAIEEAVRVLSNYQAEQR
jgi:hypothetical protein